MKRQMIFLFFLYLTISSCSNKVETPIIIDTDAAADDLRAICLLLASEENRILAITTSDGALRPKEGLIKVRTLVKSIGQEEIPTSIGEVTQPNPPTWWEFSKSIFWGDENKIDSTTKQTAPELIISSIESEKKPVTIICLGSLSNIAKSLQVNPEIESHIERIVWYNDNIHPANGVNFEIDTVSANYIFNSSIKLDVISNEGNVNMILSQQLLDKVAKINTPLAKIISKSHNSEAVHQRVTLGHMGLWDDLVSISLIHPELFETRIFKKHPNHSIMYPKDSKKVEEAILNTLSGNTNPGIIFKEFPEDPNLFNEDIRHYLPEIIDKFGPEEWKVAAITNELHGHLGIYSIIGAKMGLRAREYFHAGTDELIVKSYAGSNPPVSCLNDGLQVSTGATLGHGTISLIPNSEIPKATFTLKNNTICIKLKKEYWEIIKNNLSKVIDQYELSTEEYWKATRKLGIKFWLEWDKKEIFEINILE